MILTLPFPPAVNNLFATYNNRRIPSRRYKQWLADAASALSEQRWSPASGCVRVSLFLTSPDNRERDADNYLKAPIDFLVKAGVLAGDSRRYVRAVSAEWADLPAKPGHVAVTIGGAS